MPLRLGFGPPKPGNVDELRGGGEHAPTVSKYVWIPPGPHGTRGDPRPPLWMTNGSYGLPVVTHVPVPLSLGPASPGDLPDDAAHPWQDRPVGRCMP